MAAIPSVSGSTVDRLSGAIREVLPQSLYVDLLCLDPIFEDVVLGTAGLIPVGQAGRDLKYRRRFHGSNTGVIRGDNLDNYSTLYGDATTSLNPTLNSNAVASKIFLQQLSTVWPDPTNGARINEYGITFGLYAFKTNFMITLTEMALDNMPAATREFVKPLIKGWSNNILQFFVNSFYANGNKLGTFPATVASADVDGTNKRVALRPTEKSTLRFSPGMEIDVWPSTFPSSGNRMNQADGSSANTTTAKRVRCFVDNVDDVENIVYLVLDAASIDASTFTFATNFNTTSLISAYVTPAETYSSAGFANFFGWRKFAKWGATAAAADNVILDTDAVTSGGTVADLIDVRVHSEHKSYHKTVSGQLTNESLARTLAGVYRGFMRNGDRVDTLIGCDGLWRNMVEQLVVMQRIETGGKPSSMSGRGSDIEGKFIVDGRVYDNKTSMYLEDGIMLGVRKGGNWQLAVPPSATGVKHGMADVPNKIPVEMLLPAMTGGAMTKFPILKINGQSNAMPTEASMMPGQVRAQLFPKDQIRMLVMDGITTSRDFSAA